MRPRNKKQQRIVELSGQLRPLTTAQKQWAFRTTHEHFAYRLKGGRCTCMDCGAEFVDNREGMCFCLECGAHLQVKDTKERVIKQKSYFVVITTKAEYQVVRMWMLLSEMRKGMKAKPAYLEIGQYFIDLKGVKTVVGLQRTMGGYYFDTFAFCSPFEIRSDNEAFQRISDEWVYPHIKVTDTIKRNGFKGHCHHIHPVTLFQQLLTNPKAETLMKSGDIAMLRYLCHHPQEVDKYWNSIKVSKRAGYNIKDPQMWFDYIKMLERMGRDLHSPSLVAPSDLKHAHDEYVEKINRQRAKEQREADRKKAEADQAKFEELKGRFIGLTMTDGTIRLHTLDSVADYYDEGTRQHICVGSSAYYLKADTLVFTAKMDGKTIATVEISLKDYSVIQCRAFANGICEYTDRIAGIISANKHLIADRKTA